MRFRACRCIRGLMRYRTCRYVGVFWWAIIYYAIVEYYMSCDERCVCAVLEL